MTRPLAEIVAEGRVLQIEIAESDLLSGQRAEAWRTYDRFARANVDRLLAVAEAAMEAERLLRHALDESSGAVDSYEALWVMQSAAREALAAFDSAAVAREGEGR